MEQLRYGLSRSGPLQEALDHALKELDGCVRSLLACLLPCLRPRPHTLAHVRPHARTQSEPDLPDAQAPGAAPLGRGAQHPLLRRQRRGGPRDKIPPRGRSVQQPSPLFLIFRIQHTHAIEEEWGRERPGSIHALSLPPNLPTGPPPRPAAPARAGGREPGGAQRHGPALLPGGLVHRGQAGQRARRPTAGFASGAGVPRGLGLGRAPTQAPAGGVCHQVGEARGDVDVGVRGSIM